MEKHYQIEQGKLIPSSEETSQVQLIQLQNPTHRQVIIDEYNLPTDIFDWEDHPEISPRLERVNHDKWGWSYIIILSHLEKTFEDGDIIDRLIPVSFVLTESNLWCFSRSQDALEMIDSHIQDIEDFNLESVVVVAALEIYRDFTSELIDQKHRINVLEGRIEKSNHENLLRDLADIEKDLVVLETVLDLQKSTLQRMTGDKDFVEALNKPRLIYDLSLYNRQVNNLIHLYRNIVDATGSLLSDMMSDRLNRLMKILSSLSLIIAVGSFVGALWGINTPGLPHQDHPFGSVIVFVFAFVSMILTAMYLKYKDF